MEQKIVEFGPYINSTIMSAMMHERERGRERERFYIFLNTRSDKKDKIKILRLSGSYKLKKIYKNRIFFYYFKIYMHKKILNKSVYNYVLCISLSKFISLIYKPK